MSNVTHRSSGVNDAMCCFSSKLQREFSPGGSHRNILSADPRVGLTGVYFFWVASIPGVSTKESRELVRARRRIRELESEVEILRRANELLGKDLRPKGSTR